MRGQVRLGRGICGYWRTERTVLEVVHVTHRYRSALALEVSGAAKLKTHKMPVKEPFTGGLGMDV